MTYDVEFLLAKYHELRAANDLAAASELIAGALGANDHRVALTYAADRLENGDALAALTSLKKFDSVHRDNCWQAAAVAVAAAVCERQLFAWRTEAINILLSGAAVEANPQFLESYIWSCINHGVRPDDRLRDIFRRLHPGDNRGGELQPVKFAQLSGNKSKAIVLPPAELFFENPRLRQTTRCGYPSYIGIEEVDFHEIVDARLYMLPFLYGLVELEDCTFLGPEHGRLNPYGGAIVARIGNNIYKQTDHKDLDTYKEKYLPGTYVLPFRLAGSYFFHFMTETVLASWWATKKFPGIRSIRPTGAKFFDRIAEQVYVDALNSVGAYPLPLADGIYRVERLLIPKTLGFGSLAYQKDVLASLRLHDSPPAGEVLYLARRKAMGRAVENEEDLLRHCERYIPDFRPLYLEELSFAAQVRAFQGARAIIAPHGGGLTNLMFCQPGTAIVEFHLEDSDPCYWQLSALVGLRYLGYLAAPNVTNSSFVIDPPSLVAALEIAMRQSIRLEGKIWVPDRENAT